MSTKPTPINLGPVGLSMWDLSPPPFVQTFRLLPPLRPSPADDGMLGVLLSGAAKNEEPSDLCGC